MLPVVKMSYLAKCKKVDLVLIADELGEVTNDDMKVVDLKKLIVGSANYEEEFVKLMSERIINERLENDRIERERIEKEKERQRLEKQEENERQRLEKQEELERIERERVFELERIEKERAFELEKLRITNGNRNQGRQNEVNVNEDVVGNKPNKDLQKLIRKFDLKESEISLYLVLFERQARRAEVPEEDWVLHLLGLLPYEITQIIAREPEEKANDYEHIKKLLLKRFKLSPEKFHQKFIFHQNSNSTWSDYAFELQNYFEEWISGLGIKDFQGLKDLMITDQMKRRVPVELKEHFIDEWTKFLTPRELADKLDEYETVRESSSTSQANERKHDYGNGNRIQRRGNFNDNKFEPQNSKTDTNFQHRNYSNNSGFRKPLRNEKGESKCFNCNDYGHFSKDCPEKEQGSGKEHVTNLAITTRKTATPELYLKRAKINGANWVEALFDTGSSSCLMKKSAAQRLKISVTPEVTNIYGFGNQITPAGKTLGKAVVDVEIDDVSGYEVTVLIVEDESQPVDLLIGRTWTDMPHVVYAKVGKELVIDEAPFRKLQLNLDKRITLKAANLRERGCTDLTTIEEKKAERLAIEEEMRLKQEKWLVVEQMRKAQEEQKRRLEEEERRKIAAEEAEEKRIIAEENAKLAADRQAVEDEQKLLEDEDIKLPQVIEKVLSLKSERAQVLGDPDTEGKVFVTKQSTNFVSMNEDEADEEETVSKIKETKFKRKRKKRKSWAAAAEAIERRERNW